LRKYLLSVAILWTTLLVALLGVPRVLIRLSADSDWFVRWYGVTVWAILIPLFVAAFAVAVRGYVRRPRWLCAAATVLSLVMSAGIVAVTLLLMMLINGGRIDGPFARVMFVVGSSGYALFAVLCLVFAIESAAIVASVSRILLRVAGRRDTGVATHLTRVSSGSAHES